MSANNYLLIKQTKDPQRPYVISEQCVETKPDDHYFAFAPTLESAIKIAQQYEQEEIIEYGIKFNLSV